METNSPGGVELILLLAFLVPAILFLLTQQNTLRRVRPENRTMHPGLVWLQLIPLFGNIWQFFVITKISASITRELASWQEDSIFGPDAVIAQGTVPPRPTQGIGIAYSILDTLFLLITITFTPSYELGRTPLFGAIAWAMIICWIIYWVKLARYKNKLKRVLLAG